MDDSALYLGAMMRGMPSPEGLSPALCDARHSGSRPGALVIPDIMRLKTLANVRGLGRHMPKEQRDNLDWRHVADELAKAAAGADTASLSVALSMEGVECQEKERFARYAQAGTVFFNSVHLSL